MEPSLLQAVVEATGEVILVTSANVSGLGFRIQYVNPAFTRMTGYAPEDVIGQTPRLLQGELTDPNLLARMHAALAAGEPFEGEAINYRKDGSTFTVEWRITPVRDAQEQLTHWVSIQRDVTARRQAEKQLKLLIRELHHRVRNTLATVQAVVNATARAAPTIEEFRQSFMGRVSSLANTHKLLTEDQAQSVSFRDLLWSELQPYEDGKPGRLDLQGPDVVLPSRLAVPIGMAVHELTTNAAKYGALADPSGRLEIRWNISDGGGGERLLWTWNEHDGPPVALPTREGFGSRLLQRVLNDQVGASIKINFDPDGLRVNVELPCHSDENM